MMSWPVRKSPLPAWCLPCVLATIASIAIAAPPPAAQGPSTIPSTAPAVATQPRASTVPATAPATLPTTQAIVWYGTLKEASAQALKQNKPLLVVVGADWCAPCKVLEKELARPEVFAVLARGVAVHLDADSSEDAPAMLQTGAIPLLRVLAPTGSRIDFKEGALRGPELVKWLDGAFTQATAGFDEELGSRGEPDAASLPRLVARLGDPNVAMREAAIRRLAPHPRLAAGAVVEAFAKGNLAVRLSGLELLVQWNAPIARIDPWQPDTVTPQSIKALLDWAASARQLPVAATGPSDVALSAKQVAAARLEIDRLLAGSDAEARAARERLARYGRPLLPLVVLALKDATTDAARERLLALRYRLAASNALALSWPGGVERLASADAQVRHNAAEELVSRAGDDDAGLLLELFADPDPLVREISLRGMRAVGKGESARALMALLGDPDANVRAAVLKQLAEKPAPGMISAVVALAQKETDPDLVVHAVRVLRQSKGDAAIDGLLGLLGHANWRVRAEAAEAVAEMAGRRSGSSTSRQADVYAAMIKLLDDPDGFVVSRAAAALNDADLPLAVEPMARAASRHPDLAADLIGSMTRGSKTKPLAEKYLREFCAHADPRVRSHAIASLISITGEIEKELKALLKDSDTSVRMWAAISLFNLIESWRPAAEVRTRTTRGFLGMGRRTVEEKVDPWIWGEEFRAGQNRPAWMLDVVPELEPMTANPSPHTRLDAALPLLALGNRDKALGVIRGAVEAEAALVQRAAGAMAWLPIHQRMELFKLLVARGDPARDLSDVIEQLAKVPDSRAADAVWNLLSDPRATVETARIVNEHVLLVYTGGRYFDRNRLPQATQDEIVARAKARAQAASEWEKLVGALVLLQLSPDEAADAARRIFETSGATEPLRSDMLKIRLLALKKAPGTALAVAMLAAPEPAHRAIALSYLTTGDEKINYLREQIYVRHNNSGLDPSYSYGSNQPIPLIAPEGLKPEALTPFLASTDPDAAAGAGYLLALLGNREGLEAVIRQWRADPKDQHARKLAYRAIAALDDAEKVPILEEIYKGYEKDSYYVRDFYWTIRNMKCERSLLLRKKIRDELGMDKLR